MKRSNSKTRGGANRGGLIGRRAAAPRRGKRRLGSERLEDRRLMAGDFHNAYFPPDVNRDGSANVVDLWGVVTSLRDGGARQLNTPALDGESEGGSATPMAVDVNGDDFLSLVDVLAVIYELRGEGEAMARDDMFDRNNPNDPFTVESNSTANLLPVLANDSGTGDLTITRVGTLQGGLQGTTSMSEFGGTVTIQGAGANMMLAYTPAADFFGRDRFIYEIRDEGETDPARRLDTAIVEVFVEPAQGDTFVRFTYEIVNPATGAAITQVEQGEQFTVQVFVEDLRGDFMPGPPDERGVAAAALDVTYNSNLAMLRVTDQATNPHGFNRDLVFGQEYMALEDVDAFQEAGGVGLIDEASAAQTAFEDPGAGLPEPLGPGPFLFFEATFIATATGTLTLQGNAADSPENQIVFLEPGQLDPVPTTAVDYGMATVDIIAPVGAVADAFTRNEDLTPGATQDLSSATLDVLMNDTPINAPTPLVGIVGLGPNNTNSITLLSGSVVTINRNAQNEGVSLNYAPAENFFGIETFSYTVEDENGARDSAVVTITVIEINDAPTANPDQFTTSQNTTLPVPAPGVLMNDTDPDNTDNLPGNDDVLTVTQVNGAAANVGAVTATTNGSVTLNADGSFSYTPTTDFNGLDTFTYTVSDGQATSTATVTINVERVDQLAEVDIVLTDLNGNPLGANAQVGVGQQFRAEVYIKDLRMMDPAADLGLGIFAAFVDFVYSAPLLDLVGPVTFGPTYNHPDFRRPGNTATDGLIDEVGSSQTDIFDGPQGMGPHLLFTATLMTEQFGTAQVSVNPADQPGNEIQLFDPPTILGPGDVRFDSETIIIVNPDAQTPTANNDAYTVAGGTTLSVTTRQQGVLGNDIDPGAPNTIQALLVQDVANGTLTLNPNGTFTYTPDPGFLGTDTFTYQATDGGMPSNTATVTITVTGNVLNDTFTGNVNQVVTGNVLANDAVPAGSQVTALNGNAAAVGTPNFQLPSGARITLNANGSFSYTPLANQSYVDTFTYTVNGQTATVTIRIGTPAAPVSGFVYTDEDATRAMEPDERRLGGVLVTLRNNATGQTQTTRTDARGAYAFAVVPTGQYTITAEQPEFMIDGWDSVNGQVFAADSITLNVNGAPLRVDFGERGLRAEFVTPEDFFGQANPNGFQIATNVSNALGQEHWFSFLDGWNGFTKAEASVSADGRLATIRVTRADGQVFTLNNVNIESDPRVRLMGRLGDGVVLRFEGGPAAFTGGATPAALNGEGEANYQQAVDDVFSQGWSA